jgi:hypothetical protein
MLSILSNVENMSREGVEKCRVIASYFHKNIIVQAYLRRGNIVRYGRLNAENAEAVQYNYFIHMHNIPHYLKLIGYKFFYP